ncbi:hypothetical protein [Candidatus Thioglobus sp.]|uniref:hypothetical protein n=1 Tax=Candidatus Thioglobus sp. TaxID=2026721 RepID=UPI003D0E4382
MKKLKTLLLATLASFMMVTSTLANPVSNDADLIFSNSGAQVQSMDFARLSTTEMQETEGAWWPVYYYAPAITYWSIQAYHSSPRWGSFWR